MQDPKNLPSGHHSTTLSGYIFATKACIDNRKKTCWTAISPPHVLTIWWTLANYGWDLLASLGHPSKFQRVSRLGSVTARHSSSGCQPNFAALNRWRHLYLAGRPSRWALAHVSSWYSSCRCVFLSSENKDSIGIRWLNIINMGTQDKWVQQDGNMVLLDGNNSTKILVCFR